VTNDNASNLLADTLTEKMLGVVKEGGQFLANQLPGDYDRLKYHSPGPDPSLSNYGQGKRMVLMECDEERDEERNVIFNQHKELRLAGGSTPASVAVLLPALAVADTLLSIIGKHHPQPGWKSRLGKGTPFATIREGLTQGDHQKLQEATQTPAEIQRRHYGTLCLSLEEAQNTLAPDSAIARYTPQLYGTLQNMRGSGVTGAAK
jgi:hypothetical protein